MLFQTVSPLFGSAVTQGIGTVANERKRLFRHSKAAMCMALRAEVVGGCIDCADRGGNDSDVGCTRDRRGATSVIKKDALSFSTCSLCPPIATSVSMSSSSSKKDKRRS